jgi:hypothetical protein
VVPTYGTHILRKTYGQQYNYNTPAPPLVGHVLQAKYIIRMNKAAKKKKLTITHRISDLSL